VALVDLLGVSKAYEDKKILSQIDFYIDSGDRVAIIGKNGGGKSTLMKIICGVLDFDDGRRVIQNGITIQMLEQNPKFDDNLTVFEAIKQELKELKDAKDRYDILSLEISSRYEDREFLKEYERLTNFLDHHNAWNLDDKIKRLLHEFNLEEFRDQRVSLLSGGEQRRVALGSLLLKKPDILLLDEPTNHLDVYMVKFLEEILLRENFTLLFISHDRYFIDNIATKSIEIDHSKIRSFNGGYSSYIRQKEQILLSLKRSHDKLLKYLKAEEEWLNKGVRARLKRDEGRKARVYKLKEEAKKNPSLIKKMTLELQREQKSFDHNKNINRKKMLFELEDIAISLGDKEVINSLSMRVLQQDKIAIVGKNGSGKSTLLKVLLGQLNIDSGSIKRGECSIGYFDQHKEILDEDKNLIETFCPNGGDRVEVRGKNMHVYGYLKNFLFPKEDLDKKIGILSGGEKNRVALALLFTKKYDCLILDEPTNDLDITTINILEEYLQSFEGAILFVSHDRYFVDKISKKLLIFQGDGIVEESYQSYSEYLDIQHSLEEIHNISTSNHDNKPYSKVRVQERSLKLSYKEQKEYDQLPSLIEGLENDIEQLKICLEDPDCYTQRGLATLSSELNQKESDYEKLVDRFLDIEQKIENSKLSN
jgi:ATP-binding cassette subfamily F protein uup